MQKNMKNKKIKLIAFISDFLLSMIIWITWDKLFGFRSPPYSWSEVFSQMPLTILGCLSIAAVSLNDTTYLIRYFKIRYLKKKHLKDISKNK